MVRLTDEFIFFLVSKELKDDFEKAIRKQGYRTYSEFFRDAMRKAAYKGGEHGGTGG